MNLPFATIFLFTTLFSAQAFTFIGEPRFLISNGSLRVVSQEWDNDRTVYTVDSPLMPSNNTRSFRFFPDGKLLISMNVDRRNSGRITGTTSAQTIYFFPRMRRLELVQDGQSAQILTNSPYISFNFSLATGQVINDENSGVSVNSSFSLTNAGVSVTASEGYRLVSPVTMDRDHFGIRGASSVLKNSQGQECSIPHSRLFNYQNHYGDYSLRWSIREDDIDHLTQIVRSIPSCRNFRISR